MARYKTFHRPSIDLDRSQRKQWQEIKVSELLPGDIVPEVGQIESVTSTSDVAVTVVNVTGSTFVLYPQDIVKAFR